MALFWVNNGIRYELPNERMREVADNWVMAQWDKPPRYAKTTRAEKRELARIRANGVPYVPVGETDKAMVEWIAKKADNGEMPTPINLAIL